MEVYNGYLWGTVCDDNWDNKDASVVCRMLGFSAGVAKFAATYGQGRHLIALDNVDCKGYETNILDCSHNGWGINDCSHSEDAGVSCTYHSYGSICLMLVKSLQLYMFYGYCQLYY